MMSHVCLVLTYQGIFLVQRPPFTAVFLKEEIISRPVCATLENKRYDLLCELEKLFY